MPLSDIVTINITAITKFPTRVGFGMPLIAGYHTVWPERARLYSSTTDMVTDGFAASDPLVLAAGKAFSQSPRPPLVLIGRTENDEKKKLTITPVDAELLASYAYKAYVNGVEAKFTTDATPTVAEVCAGLAAALDPADWVTTTAYALGDYVNHDTSPVKNYICTKAGTSGATGPTGTGSGIVDGTCEWDYVGPKQSVTATDNTTSITLEADTVADVFTFYVADFRLIDINDITPNGSPSGIVEDIVAIQAVNDDWYCLHLTNQGAAVIAAAAVYIETLEKIYLASSPDSDIRGSGSTDIGSTLEIASYDRTSLFYHPKASLQFPECAWAGANLPYDPGSITWKFTTSLGGVDSVDLSATEISNIRGKNVNYYYEIADIPFTAEGKVASGEFIDVVRGIDWTAIRIQEAVFGLLANSKKVPFTDPGVALVEAAIKAVLIQGVRNGLFSANPEPTVTVPLVSEVSLADKAARTLPDVEFNALLSGAVHFVAIEGVVSV